jgi:plastocyanin domain-containing protein
VSTTDILAIAAGIAAIACVNWYFFLAERRAVEAVPRDGGVQEVAITVKGGYDPATVRVRHGQPVRLVFDRQETSGCSEEVVIGNFGIRKFLPAFQRTTVEFTPRQAGTYDFSCGMGMLHGKLIVE